MSKPCPYVFCLSQQHPQKFCLGFPKNIQKHKSYLLILSARNIEKGCHLLTIQDLNVAVINAKYDEWEYLKDSNLDYVTKSSLISFKEVLANHDKPIDLFLAEPLSTIFPRDFLGRIADPFIKIAKEEQECLLAWMRIGKEQFHGAMVQIYTECSVEICNILQIDVSINDPTIPSKRDRVYNQPPEGYVCRICQSSDHYIKECPKKVKEPLGKRNNHKVVKSECWFCLGNPNASTHLVASVEQEVYLALFHCVIVPIEHVLSNEIYTPNLHQQIMQLKIRFEEALNCKSVLIEVFHQNKASHSYATQIMRLKTRFDEALNCKSVLIEVFHQNKASHSYATIVPLYEETQLEIVYQNFINQAIYEGYSKSNNILNSEKPCFFRVTITSLEPLIFLVPSSKRIDLQFPRKVLALALGVPEKIEWRNCQQTQDEEQAWADELKEKLNK
ncbi:hypothetical protein O9G_004567 [Rozella allomycis CSF55]|uniref:CWF19-like protein 1 n=1 Tax=Rozella allomycis (strain CSF55) TaxID=988480 RepID=A0A075B1X6_ROZAC|nr:hypothetical protein O9G_004567 [Rozella allomycis CSF55]|eukprot:EPZ34971.1 hypothetical protein O9G_004567 [Rozella allomycis CSF55]